jgi:hypothetical protein
MSAIFTTAPGTLVAIQTADAPTAALIKVAGLSDTQNIIITSLNVRAETAYQVASTIGGPQYLFPFGDKLQEIQVGALVVPLPCPKDATSNNQTSAFNKLWKFYYEKRISPDKIQSVKITFAGQTISGLVTAIQANAAPQDGVPIVQCTISMLGWAESTEEGATSAGAAAEQNNTGANDPLTDSTTGELTDSVSNMDTALSQASSNPNVSQSQLSTKQATRDSVVSSLHQAYSRSTAKAAK